MPIDTRTNAEDVKRFLEAPPPRFIDTKPFHYAKYYAQKYDCDLAVPGGPIGIGSMVCYTPLVEALALRLGRPLRLLTMPPIYTQTEYPVWENNPYIEEIVDANALKPDIMLKLMAEFDNFCQSGHVIENICTPYGLRPRQLRGSLFLSHDEMQWGLKTLSQLPRPVVCLCPYGTASSLPESPWFVDKWLHLIDLLKDHVSFVHIGYDMEKFNQKPLPVFSPATLLRQAMALIWASDVYVGFDTGPSHIATAFETPTVVLWDALRQGKLEDAMQEGFSLAAMQRWSYPQNKNLVILGERDNEVLESCVEFILTTVESFKPRLVRGAALGSEGTR